MQNQIMKTLSENQLEFLGLLKELGVQTDSARRVTGKLRRKIEALQPEDFAVIVLRAVTEEQVAYSTYALMVAVLRAKVPPALAALAIQIGYSYHAVHKMIERTPWFEKSHTDLVRVGLSSAGTVKINRINQRLGRYVKHEN